MKLTLKSLIPISLISVGLLYKYLSDNLYITVKRFQFEENFTYGKMYLNGIFFCNTLEDTYRGQDLSNIKVYGETAIPNGKYKTIVSYSPKFKKELPELLNVPYFTAIRIHTGVGINSTDGCILIGDNVNGIFMSNAKYTTILTEKISQYKNCYTIIK